MSNPTTKQKLLAVMTDFLSAAPYGQAVKILKTHQKSLKK